MENKNSILRPNSRQPNMQVTYLNKANCLGEFTTEEERRAARKNLGISSGGDFNGNLNIRNLINNSNFSFGLENWELS